MPDPSVKKSRQTEDAQIFPPKESSMWRMLQFLRRKKSVCEGSSDVSVERNQHAVDAWIFPPKEPRIWRVLRPLARREPACGSALIFKRKDIRMCLMLSSFHEAFNIEQSKTDGSYRVPFLSACPITGKQEN
jgi:hypothetical protein